MVSQVQAKKEALDAAETLLGYPDAKVKTSAQVLADYLRGTPIEVDDFLRAIAPQGTAVARLELRLSGLVPSERTYEFRRPIKVVVARDDGYFIAFSNRFLIHGTGDSVEEALRDYMEEWHHHYRWLLNEAERLVPPLHEELARIQRLISREHAA